jgi:hypothetical protein
MRVVEYRMERIFGVDFSGATDAGKKVWIACGVNEGTRLCIVECMRGDTLPGSAAGRERCLAALRDLIAAESACAFGLDFPFGLPRVLVAQADWKDFILSFPTMYPDAEAFRQACRSAAEGREHRRLTDRQSRTPFSPYNLRLYRQTYFGLREVLYPLVRDRQAAVLPMQRPCRDKAWVLEICPASTLKREGLYPSVQGSWSTAPRGEAPHPGAYGGERRALHRVRVAAQQDPGRSHGRCSRQRDRGICDVSHRDGPRPPCERR